MTQVWRKNLTNPNRDREEIRRKEGEVETERGRKERNEKKIPYHGEREANIIVSDSSKMDDIVGSLLLEVWTKETKP